MNTTAITLTGITRASGVCDCCGRELGRVFELSDGNTYGRACAAKITGYKITDKALRVATHLAKVKAERIAAGWTARDFAAYARQSEGCVDDRMIYVEGRPPVLDWADQAVTDLYA